MRLRRFLFILLLTTLLTGCVPHPQAGPPAAAAAPTLNGDAAHPDVTQGWVEVKLYFGLGPADRADQGVTEAEWRAFLDREVTPRFPAGLSVLEVYGQWQGKQQTTPERLRSKMLLIYMPGDRENRAKIDAIRAAWKQKSGDQSVLLAVEPAEVSF